MKKPEKHYVSVPTPDGDQSAELFARFTYDFDGGGSVSVIVIRMSEKPFSVTEESTRYNIAAIDPYMLRECKMDLVLAACKTLDAIKRKHGIVKLMAAIDRAPKYQEPEI